MSETKKSKIFFPNLDGLRFFSFFIVFLTHALSTDNPAIMQLSWYKLIKVRMFSDGELGVSFFFVLSGFLISYLLIKEKELTNRIDVKSFYIRRILRIWPLYYFVILFGFLIFPALKAHFGQVPHETSNPLLCLTFLNNFDRIYNGDADASVITIMWSVAIEEQFYLIWPVLFFLVPSKSYRYIFIAVMLISTLFRVFYIHKTTIDYHTLGVISDMAIGGLGAYLILNSSSFFNGIKNLSKNSIFILYLSVIALIVFKQEIFATTTMQILKRLIMAGIFIMVILEQNFAEKSLFKVGNWKIISSLGKYTYGLYCLHGIAVLATITILKKYSLLNESWQIWLLQLPIALLLSIFISWVSYTYFESWFLRLKSKFAYITKD